LMVAVLDTINRAHAYWEADSAEKAAQAAIAALETKLGVRVVRLDPELVTTREIAERIGKTQQAVSQWVCGVRRQDSAFPPPYDVAGGSRVWRWGDVHAWLARWMPDRLEPERPLTSSEAREVDAWLLHRGEALRDHQPVRT